MEVVNGCVKDPQAEIDAAYVSQPLQVWAAGLNSPAMRSQVDPSRCMSAHASYILDPSCTSAQHLPPPIAAAGGRALAAAHRLARPGAAGQRGEPEPLALRPCTLRRAARTVPAPAVTDMLLMCSICVLLELNALPALPCCKLTITCVGQGRVRMFLQAIIHQTARLLGWRRCTAAACLRGVEKTKGRGEQAR